MSYGLGDDLAQADITRAWNSCLISLVVLRNQAGNWESQGGRIFVVLSVFVDEVETESTSASCMHRSAFYE